MDLSGAKPVADRRRAAVHRLHVWLHRQLSLPGLAAVRFPFYASSAAPGADRAQPGDLCQLLRPSLWARPAAAAVRRRRAGVRPHHDPLSDLARVSRDAALAWAAPGLALHLDLGEYRDLHPNLDLSIAEPRLDHGLVRKIRLVVSAPDHQLHAGQPDQYAAIRGCDRAEVAAAVAPEPAADRLAPGGQLTHGRHAQFARRAILPQLA